MRRWDESTFVFISTNPREDVDGIEMRWLAVMHALAEHGASVRFLCLMDSSAGDLARAVGGIAVDPYILDKWNVIRSHTRLRKYLKRYQPVCVHSTGLEADLLLRWAARKIPKVEVAHTMAEHPQGTRRKRPVDALMRRFDELGMRSVAGLFVESESLAEEARATGVPAEKIMLDCPLPDEYAESVARHLSFYRSLMALRGTGG